MLNSGDVVTLELGLPRDREAGLRRPVVVATAQRLLDASPRVIHVIPLTTTLPGFGSEVPIDPNESNGLDRPSVAQCQHIWAASIGRVGQVLGNVGPVALAQIRETLGPSSTCPSEPSPGAAASRPVLATP
jgi:mRNA interferase MazF